MPATIKSKLNLNATKRGDTMIEVMFAMAVFCLVAVISIAMMNLGIASAENSLETVTVRSEINAQAEALRFIHSSYISEKTLPEEPVAGDPRYQQYKDLWEKITDNAVSPADAKASGLLDLADTVNDKDTQGGILKQGCARVYQDIDNMNNPLRRVNAFVLNVRDLDSITSIGQADVGVSYISIENNRDKFVEATLNARLIYTASDTSRPGADADSSIRQFTDGGARFDRVAIAEGVWAFAVTDNNSGVKPKYYDFYIEACWYGPNTTSPTAIDTVIRLYNPEGV